LNSISILYIGEDSGTSRHRAFALRRLGYNVFSIDPFTFLPNTRLSGAWIWKTGCLFMERYIRRRVLASIPQIEFDLVYVDSGELVGPSLVRELKSRFGTVINYNVDDPYGPRDENKWRLYLRSVPFYDLVVVVRDLNVAEAFKAGARDVMRVHRSSDEVAHTPRKLSPSDLVKWGSEVAFIGTWMPERGPFLARLVELGVPLTIWGNRWSKAKEWPILRPHWRGPGLETDTGDDYAKAVQCAKVCIGLLSKGNRDVCTQRSFEIPRLGGLLCAERTSEHLALYAEGIEAVFWNDPNECAEKCKQLLSDEAWRKQVAQNGQFRSIRNGITNEAIINQIVARAFDRVREEAVASK
jgi:spore maturation protein CgeB